MPSPFSIASVGGFGDPQPRVRDLELAEHLGYERLADIRELIKRLAASGKLNDSEVIRTVRKTPGGGRPATEFWLTEAQALKVVAKSETARDAFRVNIARWPPARPSPPATSPTMTGGGA